MTFSGCFNMFQPSDVWLGSCGLADWQVSSSSWSNSWWPARALGCPADQSDGTKICRKLRFVPKKWVGLLMVTGCHLRTVGDVDDCQAPFGDPLYILKSQPFLVANWDGSESGLYYSRFAETFHIVPWFSGRPLLFWDFYDFLTWISMWCTPDCSKKKTSRSFLRQSLGTLQVQLVASEIKGLDEYLGMGQNPGT